MIRRLGYVVLSVVTALAIAVAVGFLLLDRFGLGSIAASRASAALGRSVAIAELHVKPGRWLGIRLKGMQVANLPGGSRPDMVTLRGLTAEIDVLSLVHGPAVVRHLEVDGLSVLLERVGQDETRNWRFGNGPSKVDREDRTEFPALLDVHAIASDITVRTAHGHMLQSRIDDGTLSAGSVDAPVILSLKGAYHDAPLTLDATLHSIEALREAGKPYGADIYMVTGDTTLRFQGTMTKPLAVDGIDGTLALHAPTLAPVLAMAGAAPDAFGAALDLTGKLTRSDADWTLAGATGRLDDSTVAPSKLQFVDGGHGHPDQVNADLAFERLNLDRLLAGQIGTRSGAALEVDRDPDPRIQARVAAREVGYSRYVGSDVALRAAIVPGRIALDEFTVQAFGAKLTASGSAEAEDKGVRISAEAAVGGMDIRQLRSLTGGGAVPVAGRLEAQAAAEGAGSNLGAAVETARADAVVWMTAGSISRDVIEKASIDIRRLFRKPGGMVPVSCMLGVIALRGGQGTLSPIRVRTTDGTIAGQGTFDLRRNWMDVTVGSQSSTTSSFALDVPVRISGNMNDPDVRPSSSRSIAYATGNLNQLTPSLRSVAARNPCVR